MFAIEINEKKFYSSPPIQNPSGDNVNQFVVVYEDDIAGMNMPEDVPRVKDPGEWDSKFGDVPVCTE